MSRLSLQIAIASLIAGCSSPPIEAPDIGAPRDASRAGLDASVNPEDASEPPDASVLPGLDASAIPPDAAVPDPCGIVGNTFQRCARNPLVTAGKAHADGNLEIIVADPSVLYDEDENKWKAWWQSPLAKTYAQSDGATTILYSESLDGLTWTTQEAPVLSARRAPQDWDYDRVETPSVVKVAANPPARRYVLYYSGGNFAATPTPFGFAWYQVGMAFSADGKSFTRLPASESPYSGKTTPYQNLEGLLLLGRDAFPGVAGTKDGLVADPEVVKVGAAWHLYFSSMAVDAAYKPLAFGIGHATSADGVHWTQDAKNPVLPGQQPAVLWNPDRARFEAFFNADSDAEKLKAPTTFNPQIHVTWATSPDGSTFTTGAPERLFSWDGSIDYEAHGWLTGVSMARRPDGYWLFYSGWGTRGVPAGFAVPARTDWCQVPANGCTCATNPDGTKSCWVPSVTSLNVARREALP